MADRVLWRFVAVAFFVSVIAPFFSSVSLSRKLLFSVLAAVSVAAVYYLCGFIHLALYRV